MLDGLARVEAELRSVGGFCLLSAAFLGLRKSKKFICSLLWVVFLLKGRPDLNVLSMIAVRAQNPDDKKVLEGTETSAVIVVALHIMHENMMYMAK